MEKCSGSHPFLSNVPTQPSQRDSSTSTLYLFNKGLLWNCPINNSMLRKLSWICGCLRCLYSYYYHPHQSSRSWMFQPLIYITFSYPIVPLSYQLVFMYTHKIGIKVLHEKLDDVLELEKNLILQVKSSVQNIINQVRKYLSL